MKTVRSGESIEARVGETFAVVRSGNELSGYEAELLVPDGITIVHSEREIPTGFGGRPKIRTLFRCERAGRYRIALSEARPWEKGGDQSVLAFVTCKGR